MKVFVNPDKALWPELLKRADTDIAQALPSVQKILAAVKEERDSAIMRFNEEFDGAKSPELKVRKEELESARVSEKLAAAIQQAANNIASFHKAQQEKVQIVETTPGVKCWRKSLPIERIGIYIPGGSAPLFSTVLMLAVPARIAGCKEVVLCSPPDKISGRINETVAYCARLMGINQVFAVGGAQAIAAMAYGTESVPKVSKIFGPGNRFVTAAKLEVLREGVPIDLPAGPSELLVIADDSADPRFVAADLISQAEHGEDSQVILLAQSEGFVEKTMTNLDEQITRLERQTTARHALENSRAIVFPDLSRAIEFSNLYAPEHLILALKQPNLACEHIQNAGSVFLGAYSPESAGDYASGTNHTLPTNGFASVYSGVSLDSFVKKVTFQELTKEGLKNLAPAVEAMAEAEGLEGHKEAIRIRLN